MVKKNVEKQREQGSYLQRSITRRQALKVGGLAAVGLVFSKPIIDTIRPKPAFARDYTPKVGSKPSIEWRYDLSIVGASIGTLRSDHPIDGDDLEVKVPESHEDAELVSVTAALCNVSSGDISDFLATVEFVGEKPGFASSNFVSVDIVPSAVGPFPLPEGCLPVTFHVHLNGNGRKVKLQFKATPIDRPDFPGGRLTITIEFDD